VEGAGKSVHLRALTRRLGRLGIAHLVVREPGGTPVGERARAVVLDPSLEVTPEAELLLYLASRAEFVRRLVRPALARGELVLADRYELSTYAYQGMARGLGLDRVRRLNAFATGGLKPDCTILLSVDPAVGLARKRTANDRIESERDEFHGAVARAYRELSESEPGIVRVNSAAPQRQVEKTIWRELCKRWPERFPADG